MKSIKTVRCAARLLLIIGLSVSIASSQARMASADSGARKTRSEVEMRIYFTNPNRPEFAHTCGAGEFVKRKVARSKRPADTALKLLFAGPTAEEKAKGMESLAPLGNYYLGVSIKKGTAIVNFRPGAEVHLYVLGPACRQEQVFTPIVETLKQFSTIKSVDYAINGKIIEDWDA